MSAKHQSAQVSLAFLIASAITLGMLILTIVLVGQSFRGMESAKVTAASATAKQLAVSVDDRIRAITGPPAAALAVLSHDPLARTDNLKQRLARLPVIADILTSSDIVSAVYAGYGDGDFFLLRKVRESEVSRFPDAPSNTRFLLQTITRDSEGRRHPEWHFYDQDRTLISREYPETYEFDPRSRPWYQQAKISGITELTDPYVFFTTRETGLTLSRRATGGGDNGTVFGVDVTVSDLSQQLAELRHTPSTRIGIVNREGAVLAYSNTGQSLSSDTTGAGPVQIDNLPHPALADAIVHAQTDDEIACLTTILDGEDADRARQERDQMQQTLQKEFAFIAKANIGGEFMDEADIARIRSIAERPWLRHFSDRVGLSSDENQALAGIPEESLPATETLLADKPSHLRKWGDQVPPVQKDDPRNRWGFDMKLPEYAFNRGEIHNLTIAKGTLTDEERFKINEHIVQTICMLDALPLPDRLANVPHLAGTHHERMDGKGYPCGLNSDDMGIPERIMAVADVFEALTAVDRPYKEGKTLTQALTIMARMVEDGHIDRPVFELFVRSGTYRRYGEQHLRPQQIDEVDESQFMKPD